MVLFSRPTLFKDRLTNEHWSYSLVQSYLNDRLLNEHWSYYLVQYCFKIIKCTFVQLAGVILNIINRIMIFIALLVISYIFFRVC